MQEEVVDAICREIRILVFPYADHMPPGVVKRFIGRTIAAAVRFDLLAPPIRVRLGPRRMLRAAVPEATVDEHGQTGAREENVCSPARMMRERSSVDEESEPTAVQSTP
jgi:hypothetical protein